MSLLSGLVLRLSMICHRFDQRCIAIQSGVVLDRSVRHFVGRSIVP